MKRIKKEVFTYDCGIEGCTHIIEAEAVSCINRQKVAIKAEVRDLKIFIRYVSTRQSVKLIGDTYGVTGETVKAICRRVILGFLDFVLSDESVRRYGTNVHLSHAVNHHSDMWIRVSKARLTKLETFLND